MDRQTSDVEKPDLIIITEEDLNTVPKTREYRGNNFLTADRSRHLLSAIATGTFIACAYGALMMGPDSEVFFYAIFAIVGYGFWAAYKSKFARYSQGFLTKLSGTKSGCINMIFALTVIGIIAPFADLANHILRFISYADDKTNKNNTR